MFSSLLTFNLPSHTISFLSTSSGFMYKLGGSGLKPKKWQKRYFVLTDDNCLYYFKSPKVGVWGWVGECECECG